MSDYGKLFSTEHVERGRYEEAISSAESEASLDPTDPEPIFNRGRARVLLERFEEGLRDLELASRMSSDSSALDAWFLDDFYFAALKTWALRAAGSDRERARTILRRYLEIFPQGRHIADVDKWEQHFDGVVKPWIVDRGDSEGSS